MCMPIYIIFIYDVDRKRKFSSLLLNNIVNEKRRVGKKKVAQEGVSCTVDPNS